MGGPAYPPSLTSGRVTLPKVERNTWRPQVPRSTTSTHSRPVFPSILVSAPALPTLARGRQPTLERQRLRPSAANCPGSGLAAGPPLSKTRLPLVICSYRSSQGTWMGGQAGSESLPSSPGKGASRGRRWIGCKPAQDQTLFPAQTAPMPDLICPNVEFDRIRFYFMGTTHLLAG